jgi:hypothetical protein
LNFSNEEKKQKQRWSRQPEKHWKMKFLFRNRYHQKRKIATDRNERRKFQKNIFSNLLFGVFS